MLGLGIALQQLLHRVACGNVFVHHAAYCARDRHLDRRLSAIRLISRAVYAFRNVTQLAQHLGKGQPLREPESNRAIARKFAGARQYQVAGARQPMKFQAGRRA